PTFVRSYSRRRLASSPTRRSSDLTPVCGSRSPPSVTTPHSPASRSSSPTPKLPRPAATSAIRCARDEEAWASDDAVVRTITVLRSEEHTSELQSRFDLVCRLLLE